MNSIENWFEQSNIFIIILIGIFIGFMLGYTYTKHEFNNALDEINNITQSPILK
jgi:Tfp pilus assembly protein PilO